MLRHSIHVHVLFVLPQFKGINDRRALIAVAYGATAVKQSCISLKIDFKYIIITFHVYITP